MSSDRRAELEVGVGEEGVSDGEFTIDPVVPEGSIRMIHRDGQQFWQSGDRVFRTEREALDYISRGPSRQ